MKQRYAPPPLSTVDPGWLAVFAGPVAWYLEQQASYWLTPLACNTGMHWPLFAVSAACLVIDLTGAVIGWRTLDRLPGKVGLMGTLLFAIAILSDVAAKLFLDPCQR